MSRQRQRRVIKGSLLKEKLAHIPSLKSKAQPQGARPVPTYNFRMAGRKEDRSYTSLNCVTGQRETEPLETERQSHT